jgi:hypothetical protein
MAQDQTPMFDIPSFRRLVRLAIAGGAVLAAAPAARADFLQFVTPAGSKAGGQPVDATASITTGNGTVSITLINNEANPTSDSQGINGIIFTFGNDPSSVSLAGSSAVQRTIVGDKSYSDSAAPLSTIWTVSYAGPTVTLTTIGNAHAPETIIGGPAADNTYDAANQSITGANHNPFLAGTATFTLSAPGVTASTTIESLKFAFGTSANVDVTGARVDVTGASVDVTAMAVAIPEPSSIALLTLGVGAIGVVARRRLARAA